MQFSTTPTLEGQTIVEYCGVVTGEALADVPVRMKKNCVKHGRSPLRN